MIDVPRLEDLGDLELVWRDFEGRFDKTDDGGHGKSCPHAVPVEAAENIDMAPVQADLFLGFAQRRLLG